VKLGNVIPLILFIIEFRKVITERTTHEQQSLNKTLPAKSLVDEVEPWEV